MRSILLPIVSSSSSTCPPPPPPGAGEVQIRVKAVGLNHIDVWGFRGMAFAKRKLPLSIGAEASGEVAAVGEGVTNVKPGQKRRDVWRADLRATARPAGKAATISARTSAVSMASTSTAFRAN